MQKRHLFWGKSGPVDLAQVMAFERPNHVGINEILSRRRSLIVMLKDGSDIVIEGDEDTDGFIIALDDYLEADQP